MKPVAECRSSSAPGAAGVAFDAPLSRARLADYVELTKPRIASLVLVTTAVGFALASVDGIDLIRLLHTIVGTALAAAGANSLNQYLERDVDALMPRTARRPIPTGRMAPIEAAGFGVLTSLAGVGYLFFLANPLAAAVAAVTVASYVLIYTPLKRRTPWCTPVGAVPGALPPVIGWAAARGDLSLGAWLLFAIIFVWQIPHFWSIAWMYRDDYRRGGLPMLPVIDADGRRTARQVVGLSVLLLVISVLPSWTGMAGAWYAAGAILLGAGFIAFGVWFSIHRTRVHARRLMLASIAYLPLVLGLLLIDR